MELYKVAPHTPPHYFRSGALYMVTAGTYQKQRLLDSDEKRQQVLLVLFEQAERFGWNLQAWAILSNHYHFVAEAPENALTLKSLIQALHSISGKFVNRIDGSPGRQVWYNYWDSCITHESSYLARMHYVNLNPVKHGLVQRAEDYSFCSYRWLLDTADVDLRDRIFAQPIDRIQVRDDF
jgi:putative transposase